MYIIKKIISRASFLLGTKRAWTYPREIWIEPTTRCNMRCITCEKYLKPAGLHDDMEPQIYERIRTEILPHVWRAYLIGLGEPLLSPLFPRMVEDCIRLGVKFNYTTNGLLLTPELAEQTMQYGFGLTLSVDGATRDTFESIRRGMKWETLLEKIALIKEAKEHVKPREFYYGWNFVVMRRNVHELEELLTWAARSGVGFVTVWHFGVGDRDDEIARESLIYNPQLAEEAFPRAEQKAKELDLTVYLPGVPTLKQPQGDGVASITGPWALPEGKRYRTPYMKRCYAPWYYVYVRYDGDIWPCCMFNTFPLGNLKEQSFREIWNSTSYGKFRRRIHSGNPPYWCAHCNLQTGITGGMETFFDDVPVVDS